MTRQIIVLGFVLLGGVASSAYAQTKGRVSVGVSTTVNLTTDGDVGTGKGVGILVRLNPKPGWGAAGAFNWIAAELTNPEAGSGDFARLRTRPLMAGVSYSTVRDRLLTSYSVVAGPSFNRARFSEGFVRSAVASIDADTSFAVRPGVGLTYTLRERVAVVGFGGYLINRPSIVYRASDGTEFRDRWSADAVVLSVGVVYSLF
jgi:hypothetical protein